MKHLKIFESYYINDRVKHLKKLDSIIDFMEKYKMDYFVIGNTDKNDNYHFEYIEKKEDEYFIEYIDYSKPSSTYRKHNGAIGRKYDDIVIELFKLPNKIIDILLEVCKDRMNIEYHLEIGTESIDMFLNMVLNHDKPIDFNEWIFVLFLENELQDDVNKFDFQNKLFTKHPEAFNSFMSVVDKQQDLKLHPKIKNKFKDLYNEYDINKKEKEYNI